MTVIMVSGLDIYSESITLQGDTTYFMSRSRLNGEKLLGIKGNTNSFIGMFATAHDTLLCPLSPENGAVLRTRLPWLNPVPLGAQTSFGFGDRLGLATPGHISALSAVAAEGKIAPILAQQSVRENTRIGRTPQQVMDAATWGAFQMGWRAPWGADADHVKEVDHLPAFVAAGYTFYTIDPSDHVDNEAQTDTADTLRTKATNLPWNILHSSYEELKVQYCATPIYLNDLVLHFDEKILLQALAKYGDAIAHTWTIYQALVTQMAGKPFDLELSVDETDTPTSIHEHFYIVNELKRLGIPVVSLAPRFVGKFQKGVDYMGDLAQFEAELVKHMAIMNHFGSYKLSIHTGSDKFSIYPIIAKHAKGHVHVKTAGTSYLEALRIIARYDPAFFRRILQLSRSRFEKDRKSYYLDAQLSKVPEDSELVDTQLPDLLDRFDARQVLHVAFGSVLVEFGAEFHKVCASNEAAYEEGLVKHFKRHLLPFADGKQD